MSGQGNTANAAQVLAEARDRIRKGEAYFLALDLIAAMEGLLAAAREVVDLDARERFGDESLSGFVEALLTHLGIEPAQAETIRKALPDRGPVAADMPLYLRRHQEVVNAAHAALEAAEARAERLRQALEAIQNERRGLDLPERIAKLAGDALAADRQDST